MIVAPMNRTYPRHVSRNIQVPDWAKLPFVPRAMPPAMVFPIGNAKAIARHEWALHYGGAEPNQETVKKFVFSFPWRWRGDETHRYAVLARWAYEFIAAAEKERAAAAAYARRSAAAEHKERPDIVLSPLLGAEESWEVDWETDDDLRLSPSPPPDRRGPVQIKRFILLNPPRPKRPSGGKKGKR